MSLPIINISPFLLSTSTSASRKACAESVHSACIKFGFFYLTGLESVVDAEEFKKVLDVGREFFETNTEEKKALSIRDGDGARGYQMIGQNVTQYKADWHEALDLYCPVPSAEEDPKRLLYGPNQWPTNPSNFQITMEEWVEKMKIVGMALLEATAMGLGLDMEGEEWEGLRSSAEKSFWVMRVIGYPPLPKDAPGVSCGSHCDYGLWTLLHADSTRGALQVFSKDVNGTSEERGSKGNWILASPIEHAIVVNIGDMWEIITNSLYKATLHRVLHTGSNYRVSLPFFYEPAIDALIAPLPSIVALQASQNSPYALNPKPAVIYGDHLRGKVSGNFTAPVIAV